MWSSINTIIINVSQNQAGVFLHRHHQQEAEKRLLSTHIFPQHDTRPTVDIKSTGIL